MQHKNCHGLLRRAAAPFVLLIVPSAAVHAADSCEATFSMKGSDSQGYVITAQNPSTGVNAQDAIEMMKKAAAEEEFEIDAPTFTSGEGHLVMRQKASFTTRGFPMEAVATDDGRLTLTATLPKKMGGDQATLRTYACNLVSRVKGNGFKAYTAIPSRFKPSDGSGPMPVPFEPAEVTDICMRVYREQADAADDSKLVYQTFTYFNGTDDARTVMGRIKAKLGGLQGMRVVGETYAARSGFLDIEVNAPAPYIDTVGDYIHASSAGDLRSFPIRVTVDSAIDQVSIVVSPNAKQRLDKMKSKLAVCSLAAAAGGVPDPVTPPAQEPPKRKIFNNPFKRNDPMAAMEAENKRNEVIGAKLAQALYERSNYAGKAFVFVPMLNLYLKYQRYSWDQIQTELMADYWQDASSRVIWQLRGSPSISFATGLHTGNEDVGSSGYWTALAHDKTLYALYIVEPGTYDLTGLAVEQRRAELAGTSSVKWKANPTFGLVTAVPTVDNGFYMNSEWQPATYRTSSSPESSCALAVGGVGPCVSYSTQMVSHTEQTSAGHYADVKRRRLEPGVALSAKLTKPLASFTVARSQVVLIDGILGGGIHLDKSACKTGDNDVATCALSSATLYKVPASVDGIQKEAGSMQPGPASDVFTGVTALPITINANLRPVVDKPGSWEAGWAKQLSFGN